MKQVFMAAALGLISVNTLTYAEDPPQAKADVVVRVAGNTIEAGVPGDILAEFRVLLFKKDGAWLIRDVEADRTHLGQPR